jgi:hypothetical protein
LLVVVIVIIVIVGGGGGDKRDETRTRGKNRVTSSLGIYLSG